MMADKYGKTFSVLNLTLAGGLGVLGGIWLIVAPFIFDYNLVKVNGENATLMGIICGIVTILIALFCIGTERVAALRPYRYLAGVALIGMGIWLMLTPYLFNYSTLRNALWNLQITGGIFALVAGFVMQEMFSREKLEQAH